MGIFSENHRKVMESDGKIKKKIHAKIRGRILGKIHEKMG